jgi:hypothetical protein
LIVCGHSEVKQTEGGWEVRIDELVGHALNLFPGQVLFGASDEGSRRIFLSPLKLNPHVSYFRVFLEDIRGSLASMTDLFSERGINILSGGAFGFGNIWVSEFIADFKGVDEGPEGIVNEIEGLGGFVTSREITELFPKAFELESTYQLRSDDDGLLLSLPELPERLDASTRLYAVLKAWPQVQALFLDFISSRDRLLKITAKISDVPGSLNKLADLLGGQVNLHAIHEQHHDEVSGEWTIYGVMEIGSVEELKGKARRAPTVLRFDVEPLGWEG